ncbi:MAG: response regulator [bacterium]
MKILLAEDDDLGRQSLARILRKMGHIICEAKNSHDLLRQVDESIDLIMLDLKLSPIDSSTVIEQVRQNQDLRQPIIAMTGLSPGEIKKAELFDKILFKPLKVESVVAAILSMHCPSCCGVLKTTINKNEYMCEDCNVKWQISAEKNEVTT